MDGMEEIANLLNEMKEKIVSITTRSWSVRRCDFNCDHCKVQTVSMTSRNSSPNSRCDAAGDSPTVEELTNEPKKDEKPLDVGEPIELQESTSSKASSQSRRSSTRATVMFKCQHCYQSFKNMTELEKHAVSHSQPRPFKCIGCEKAFMQKKHLKEHEWKVCRAKTFKCTECARTFRDRQKCKDHVESHAIKTVGPKRKAARRDNRVHLCPVCKERFSTTKGLSIHLMKHSGLNPFKCNRCDQKFTKLSTLRVHSARAHKAIA